MAQIDPTALNNTHIAFVKTSGNLDFEEQSMMRPVAKNCTMLISSTYNTGQNASTTRPEAFVRERERGRDEEVATSSSTSLASDSVPSTGLRLIRVSYSRRDSSSSSSRSPPATVRSAKRIKLNLSSASSSSRSSSVSSITTSSTAVSSNTQSQKTYHVVVNSHQKATGRYLNNAYFAQSTSPVMKSRSFRDITHYSERVIRRPSAISLNGGSTLDIAKYSSVVVDRPSTSKGFIPETHIMPNGAVKRRLPVTDSQLSPQGNRVVNGRIERKRVLSERGELEALFPVIDRTILHTTWQGSHMLNSDSRNTGVGLINYSNDCFLNSVLQLIVHTAPLARYIGEQHSSFSCERGCFICDLGLHVRHAITSKAPFKPSWIDGHLRKIFPSHCPGVQEDAHELFNLVLDALDAASLNGTPYEDRDFRTENRLDAPPRPSKPIEQIFGGTARNQIKCLNCSEVFINYERIRELNLGLKMQDYQGPICLKDLLDDYFSTETLNNFECRKCHQKTKIHRSSRILRAPNVLLIQLKRFGTSGGKINSHVSFEQTLRLEPYEYNSAEPVVYELNGVVQHLGEGMDHGHYNAAVRGFDGRSWYLFDDEQRHKISLEELHNMQAYMLVYVRRETSKETIPKSSVANDTPRGSPSRNRIVRRPSAQSYSLIKE